MIIQSSMEERIESVHLGQGPPTIFTSLHEQRHVAVDDVVLEPRESFQRQDLVLGDLFKSNFGHHLIRFGAGLERSYVELWTMGK